MGLTHTHPNQLFTTRSKGLFTELEFVSKNAVRRPSDTLIVRVFSTVCFVTVSRVIVVVAWLYSKPVRDLIQWSLWSLRDPQALSSTLALLGTLQLQVFRSLKRIETLDLISVIYGADL